MTLRLALAGLQHPHLEQVLDAVRRRPGDVAVVGLSEAEDAVRERFRVRLGVPAYPDHRELLARLRPDAVAVAAANGDRAAIVADALDAGAHVVCDKPICTTLEGLEAIETAWRGGDRVLHCLLEKRLWPETVALREVVASGELGELAMAWASAPHRLRPATRPAWTFRRAGYGGILNDLAVHDVDLMLHLTGARGGWVQGWAGNKGTPAHPELEDHGLLLLRCEDGPLATLEAHWLSPEAAAHAGDYRMLVTGVRGTADVRFLHHTTMVTTHDRGERTLPSVEGPTAADDFLEAALGLAPARITAPEVLTATRVCLIAQAHANDGAWHRWEAWGPARVTSGGAR